MQIPPEQKQIDVDRADFVVPVGFSVLASQRAFVGKDGVTAMKADLRSGVLHVTVKRSGFEEKHIVPFANVKLMIQSDPNRKRVEAPVPTPVEPPKPKPAVDDTIKL